VFIYKKGGAEMTSNQESNELMTVGEVARLLHIHPNTVRLWSNKGILESYRISKRGDRRFKKEDVALLFDSWLLDYSRKSDNRKDNLPIHV
jgi:excisionase family DNA binding protein